MYVESFMQINAIIIDAFKAIIISCLSCSTPIFEFLNFIRDTIHLIGDIAIF